MKHFFQGSTFEILLNFCAKNPPHRQAENRYGEALLQCGIKEEAIKMYQKSVELNPDNENGKKVLSNLLNN